MCFILSCLNFIWLQFYPHCRYKFSLFLGFNIYIYIEDPMCILECVKWH